MCLHDRISYVFISVNGMLVIYSWIKLIKKLPIYSAPRLSLLSELEDTTHEFVSLALSRHNLFRFRNLWGCTGYDYQSLIEQFMHSTKSEQDDKWRDTKEDVHKTAYARPHGASMTNRWSTAGALSNTSEWGERDPKIGHGWSSLIYLHQRKELCRLNHICNTRERRVCEY